MPTPDGLWTKAEIAAANGAVWARDQRILEYDVSLYGLSVVYAYLTLQAEALLRVIEERPCPAGHKNIWQSFFVRRSEERVEG